MDTCEVLTHVALVLGFSLAVCQDALRLLYADYCSSNNIEELYRWGTEVG